MKKPHLLMALLTLFGVSSPANAVGATIIHGGLEARVSDWVVDHETSTITNNEELRQGRDFTADQLTTIFKDLRDYLTAPDRYDYKIIVSYLRYDSVYADLCQNDGPQIRSFVSKNYQRVFPFREMPADFQAQLHDLVKLAQQHGLVPEEETKEETPRKRMRKK